MKVKVTIKGLENNKLINLLNWVISAAILCGSAYTILFNVTGKVDFTSPFLNFEHFLIFVGALAITSTVLDCFTLLLIALANLVRKLKGKKKKTPTEAGG